MFFPYRAKIELHRVPVLTILVSLLCIGIFAAQSSNRRALHEAAVEYCEQEHGRGFLQALRRIAGADDSRTCTMLMLTLANSKDEKAELGRIVQRAGSAERLGDQRLATYYEQALLDAYRSFRVSAPTNLTARLAYSPDSWNPLRMLSAAVSHGSWSHVIGNLIFFYAFAATIEILLGPALYLAVLLVLALGTHSVYSLAMMHNPQALPTVGLSGVVMGMIALFVYFIPQARISCFLWLIFFYRRFAARVAARELVHRLGSLHDVHARRKHRSQSRRPPFGRCARFCDRRDLLSRQAPLGAGEGRGKISRLRASTAPRCSRHGAACACRAA